MTAEQEDWTDVDREIRQTRGRILGEAVWRRLCQAAGIGPKDPARQAERERVVTAIQAAAAVLDETGFEGLEEWLEMEEAAQ